MNNSLVKNVIVEEKTRQHPCFHCGANDNARIHLPVAPACNIQCNYCVRKFDCVNESRPGVVSEVLTPSQSVRRFKIAKDEVKNLTVVGIAGPGDALANFEEVKETIHRIRMICPDITFCISTNGLMLPFYANHLISLGVSHVTVTVNTVKEETGAMIYDHITYLGRSYHGIEGAALLLRNQLAGIRYLSSKGIVVKVNIVAMKGMNQNQILEVIHKVKSCGCKITNIIPLIPIDGSRFANQKPIDKEELKQLRKEGDDILPQMYHCKQCRADAVGTLKKDQLLHLFPKEQEVRGSRINR